MPLEEAGHPRVLRGTEAPEQELLEWVPVSMNLWVLCVAVLDVCVLCLHAYLHIPM